MAEEQAEHRRHIEKVVVESGAENERLGMHYGFLIGLVGIVASVALVWNGMTSSSLSNSLILWRPENSFTSSSMGERKAVVDWRIVGVDLG